MTITQHAHIYSFHTSKFNFGEIFFLIFLSIQPLLLILSFTFTEFAVSPTINQAHKHVGNIFIKSKHASKILFILTIWFVEHPTKSLITSTSVILSWTSSSLRQRNPLPVATHINTSSESHSLSRVIACKWFLTCFALFLMTVPCDFGLEFGLQVRFCSVASNFRYDLVIRFLRQRCRCHLPVCYIQDMQRQGWTVLPQPQHPLHSAEKPVSVSRLICPKFFADS